VPWLLILFREQGRQLQPTFHAFCHQMPARTLVVMGNPMVVCSRCAGIYAGMALGALMPSCAFLARRGRLLLVLALGAMLLDVLLQDGGMRPSSHVMRLSTGFFVGWSASAFLFASLEKTNGASVSS